MECNKDEAIRAKQLAEKKLTEKDIVGAKRFASKAQSLFPGLEGLPQLQEILDVYVASQKKVNGVVDWYEVFGVDPLADDETIRKKYRKLALALHPDKNKSIGADGAFKIISEAWSLLSDKAKRDAYNEKRNIRASCKRARDVNPPAGFGKSTYKNFTSSSSKPRNPTTQDKSQQDIKASYKKDRSRNVPRSNNNFTNTSSSTINPATNGKPQQDTRPSHEKARGGNPPVSAGSRSCDNFTGRSSKINPVIPDNVQQDKRASYQKTTDCNHPAAAGKSGYNTSSNGTSGSRNPPNSKHPQTVPDNVQQDKRASYQKTTDCNHPAAAGKSGYNTSSNGTSGTRNPPNSKHPQTVPACRANRKTFWTACKTCMMQYEYVHIYRNQKLLCPNCRKPFLAIEMPSPHGMGNKSATKVPCGQKQQGRNDNVFHTSSDSGRKSMETSGYSSFNSARRAGIPQVSSSRCNVARSELRSVTSTGQPAKNCQSTDVNLKRRHEEVVNIAVNEETLWKKSTAPGKPDSDIGSNFSKQEISSKKRRINGPISYGGETGNQRVGFGREKVELSRSKKNTCFRDLSHSETCSMLMYKAKMAILKKISDWGTGTSGKACKYAEKERPNTNASEKSVASGMKKEEKVNASFDGANSSTQAKNSLSSSAGTISDTKATEISVMLPFQHKLKECSLSAAMGCSYQKANESMTRIISYSDFIDFDKDRAEGSFAENQVWAAYDDKDGMPRSYGLVQGVTASHPSEVKIRWLISRGNTDLGTLNWVHCGFSKTCGDFKISRCEVDVAVNSFSHRVNFTKFVRGIVQIFPRKGDVWALYRNWSSDWNEVTPDDVIRKYDMVEVLEDYNEEYGVLVAPLVKVAGFKSVFHRHLDPRKIYRIPREEMFRFSHQVPSHFITGHGGEKKAPKGSWELDPAAMPEELLQVITEPKEEEVEGTGLERMEEEPHS